ncbi:MAG TPA: hypothetical protein VF463_02945 [Sphingobium sp.]
MVKEGSLITSHYHDAEWLHLPNEPRDRVDQRHDELRAIWRAFTAYAVTQRTGQALEIAVQRAILAGGIDLYGGYRDIDAQDDGILYTKTDLRDLNGRNLGNKSLDFIVAAGGHHLGIEIKNKRLWYYAKNAEIRELLFKALTLDVLPVLIARRIQYSAFKVFGTCGLIIHETFNQRLAQADAAIAAQAAHKNLLGYHDIRVGNHADARLTKFIGTNLPLVVDEAAAKIAKYRDLLWAYATREMGYQEFSGRVRRRSLGQNEDADWKNDQEDQDTDPGS